MKSALDRKLRLAFGSAILALFLLGALSYRWVIVAGENANGARHTGDVLETLRDLDLAMESVESSSRGFALTGRDSSLDNFGPSVSRARHDIAAVRTLTADNPAQQTRLTSLEGLAAVGITRAEIMINLRGSQGIAAAISALDVGDGDPFKAEFQSISATMRGDELRLRTQRAGIAERNLNRTKAILLVGTLLSLLVATFAASSVLTEMRKRRLTELALRESEERCRMLLEGVQDYAIFMLSPSGQITSWSPSAERMMGFNESEIVGRSFDSFFPPEDVAQSRPEEILRIVAQKGQHETVTMYVRKDGSTFLANVTFRTLRDEDGNLRGISEICRDLTEQTTLQERYQGLLEAAPDGLVVVNEAGEIVLLNARAETQFGYRRDELLGQKVTSIILNGFDELLTGDGSRSVAEMLADQVGTGIELGAVRKDGTEFSIELMLSPLAGPSGLLVTAAIRDITARKDAERHLAQMEARYRGLLEAAPDGMVVVDQAGTIVLLNAQAEKQFGYHRDELLGQRVTNIIPHGFAERLIADSRRTTAEALAQQIGTGIELHGRRKDETQFPIEIMLSPLEDIEGILVTAAIRDISERKQMERQLHQSQKMEAVGQLTGGIAHDFNNLLTVIVGNLGLLEMSISDNEAAVKRVRTAQKAAARGADITRRLLMFSSSQEFQPTFVQVGDSIHNMIEMASRGLGLDITIKTRVSQSVPPLFVDPALLESALLNLVVNARDAMPKGGSILITADRQTLDNDHPVVLAGDLKQGPYVCVSVADTGQGMSRETVERACEPFFTTKPHDKGTGLGLSMVYGFVKQARGAVRIYSEVGHGTTVSLYLPILQDTSAPPALMSSNHSTSKMSGTVLVVDDEADILEVAIAYLSEMGFATLDACDGASALLQIQTHHDIDLIITDIVMAGEINGAELGKRARALCPDVRIIYSSGFQAEVLAERSMPPLDGPLLRKPYQRADFMSIVRRVMECHGEVPA